MDQQNIAILGLGIVGSRVRARLIDAGHRVTSWSRTYRGLEGEKTTAGEAVVGADVVGIFLKDAPALRQVMTEVIASLRKGVLVMNHATVDLPTTSWLAGQCTAHGCEFLDAPFTGSKEAAAAGQLLFYVGGCEALMGKVTGYFESVSKGWMHCGEVGTATVTKLATNLISACTMQAMGEALLVASKHGVRPEVFTEAAIRNGSGSPLMAMKYPGILKGDFEPHFTLSNMWKDSRYALALAEMKDVELPGLSLVSRRMGEMCATGMGDLDYSAIAKADE